MFRLLRRLMLLVFVLVVLGGCVGCYLGWLVVAPGPAHKAVELEVAQGTTTRQLAEQMQGLGAVSHAWLFSWLLRGAHLDQSLRSGHYQLPAEANQLELVKVLKQGPQAPPGTRVTIPEGKTLKEVATLLEEQAGVSADDFLTMCYNPRRSYPQLTWLVEGQSAEGYVFPDTYDIADDARPSQVLEMMLKRFGEVVLPVVEPSAAGVVEPSAAGVVEPPAAGAVGQTEKEGRRIARFDKGRGANLASRLREKLVLASLVEAEAQVASERPRIAAVYLNRLAQSMNLQCDATILYALGERKSLVTLQDLEVDSPYNTYRRPGLPPGPICNPGLASIRAAYKPGRERYLYYVRNDRKNDGSHVFTSTYAEHQQAIVKWQRAR